ncbi:DUF861 domain-containing protein [Haliea sp. AH-315-K21]|uniref:(S)-ureidoglycine aminohydrolase cupin domain-containing protein n=1 Tax=SAR86 cluster bacterium TaxID=2030880 RepID=A0A2A5CCS4_9GAMM|nr:DUF861 domain-containing protein [Haliea sp. AH-315-K21]PCJ41166.1 MAG: hypothetical protein COA71_08965 [SAR86 cluster bacterium]
MKSIRVFFTCLFSLVFSAHLFAQDIVRLDKAALSGLGLEGGPTEGGAVRYGKTLYDGDVFNVSVAAGNGPDNIEVLEIESFGVQEFCYLINGTATFIGNDGRTETFHTGDFFVIPKGWGGTMITQGNHLYQVLLVVSDDRSDPVPDAFPTLIDRTNMSGLGLEASSFGPAGEFESNRKIMWDGAELVITIMDVEPNSGDFTDMAEEFVYVLNGSATLTAVGGEPQTFYRGDFFVVPEGWDGNWTVDGNHLYRELIALSAD